MARDNFSEKTKETCAKRVAFRCSNPKCRRFTVGPSSDCNDKSLSIGEAAHIYAASKNGPRFNSEFVGAKATSIDNCIWLCSVCHKIIDTDCVSYTPEKLISWKKETENWVKTQMSGNWFTQEIKENKTTLEDLEILFNNYYYSFEFDACHLLLNDMKNELCQPKIEKLYNQLKVRLLYIENSTEVLSYISKLEPDFQKHVLPTVLEFADFECLTRVYSSFEDEDYQHLIRLYSNRINPYFVINDDYKKIFDKLCPGKYHQFITNYCIRYRVNILLLKDNQKVNYFEGNRFYKILAETLKINSSYIYPQFKENLFLSFDYLYRNQEYINKLHINYQTFINRIVLIYIAMNHPTDFLSYYNRIEQNCKDKYEIKSLYMNFLMITAIDKVDFNEVLLYCKENDDNSLICNYLTNVDYKKRIKIFDEYKYLCKEDSRLLFLYCDNNLEKEKIKDFILNKDYSDIYENDFLYLCMLAEFCDNSKTLNEILEKADSELNNYNIELFMSVLIKYERIEEFKKYYDQINSKELKYILLTKLQRSNVEKYNNYLIEQYEKLLNDKYSTEGLSSNCGFAYYKKGLIEKAKEYYKREFKVYKRKEILRDYLIWKIESSDYSIDETVNSSEMFDDYSIMFNYANILAQNNKINESLIFYQKALLKNINNNACYVNMFFILNNNPIPTISTIKEDTLIILNSGKFECEVVILNRNIISNEEEYKIDGVYFVSEQSQFYKNNRFCNINDKIIFKEIEYTIKDIKHVFNHYEKLALQYLISQDSTKTITSIDGEDPVKQIIKVLKDSDENFKKKIAEYDNLTINLPLSFFANNVLEKNQLKAISFLIDREHFYKNNFIYNNYDFNQIENLIVSFEDLYLLFFMNEKEKIDVLPTKFVLPVQVKNEMLNCVNAMLNEVEQCNCSGQMFMIGNNPIFKQEDNSSKRTKYAYLNRLKDFVNRFRVFDKSYDYIGEGEFESFYREKDFHTEKSTFAAYLNTPNSIMLLENEFDVLISNNLGYKNIGIVYLLNYIYDDPNKILSIMSLFAIANFKNYLTVNTYLYFTNQKDSDVFPKFINGCFLEEKYRKYYGQLKLYLYKELHILKQYSPLRDFELNCSLFQYIETKNEK